MEYKHLIMYEEYQVEPIEAGTSGETRQNNILKKDHNIIIKYYNIIIKYHYKNIIILS